MRFQGTRKIFFEIRLQHGLSATRLMKTLQLEGALRLRFFEGFS
jgi:hypothetical protein